MEEEQFWGFTLSADKKECEWNPDMPKKQDRPAMKGMISLLLKQAVLGKEAKEGEVNIVEVEAVSTTGDTIKLPVLYLKGGSLHQQLMNVTLPEPPAKIMLTSGSGPIHLTGVEKIDFKYAGGDIEDDEDMDDEELEEEDMDDELDDKVDDDLDDEDDEDNQIGKGKKGKMVAMTKAKAPVVATGAAAKGPKGKK